MDGQRILFDTLIDFMIVAIISDFPVGVFYCLPHESATGTCLKIELASANAYSLPAQPLRWESVHQVNRFNINRISSLR